MVYNKRRLKQRINSVLNYIPLPRFISVDFGVVLHIFVIQRHIHHITSFTASASVPNSASTAVIATIVDGSLVACCSKIPRIKHQS